MSSKRSSQRTSASLASANPQFRSDGEQDGKISMSIDESDGTREPVKKPSASWFKSDPNAPSELTRKVRRLPPIRRLAVRARFGVCPTAGVGFHSASARARAY